MILLLGKTGYVSKRFQDFFNYKKISYVVESLRNEPTAYNVEKLIDKHKPRFVINAIGYTGVPNVDACEDNKIECLYGNVIIAEIVANACKKYNVPLGFVSSGCIYNEIDSESTFEFNEIHPPNFSFPFKNCSFYSGTKALGETLVNKTYFKTFIWRIRMPFNHIPGPKNYLSKILDYSKVWSSPNSLTNLDEFVQIAYYSLVKEIPFGIYNMTNPGGISAKQILEIAKEYNIIKEKYEYFQNLEEFSKYIKTPRSNCVLDSSKISQEGFGFLSSEESLRKTFQNWKDPEKTPFWD
jgi:dTDP-4-dehydrorhamnose reductase